MLHRSDATSLPVDSPAARSRIRKHAGLHPLRAVPDVLSDLRAVAARISEPTRPRWHGAGSRRRPPRSHARFDSARAELSGVRRLLGGLPGRGTHGPAAGQLSVGHRAVDSALVARAAGATFCLWLAVHAGLASATAGAPAVAVPAFGAG